MYLLAVFYSQGVHFGHCGRKCTSWAFFPLFRYVWAILREKIAGGGVLPLAGTFQPFGANVYRLGNVYSEPVHFGHFGRKCTVRVLHAKPVALRLFWGKNVPAPGFFMNWYVLATLGENTPAGGRLCFLLRRYIMAILGENVRARNSFIRVWYILAILDENATAGVFFIFGQYIVAVLNENVLAGNFSSSACIFWPFWAKMYLLGVLHPQPVHFSHFGRKCTGWGFLYSQLVYFRHSGEKSTCWQF